MKRHIFILWGILLSVMTATAQPSAVKNAAKSVFTLTTFKADGSLLASSHGIFVDANGTAISDWKSFDGASRAVVVDAAGKSHDVVSFYGVNEIYNVAKFKVTGKTTGATIAQTGSPEGATIYLVGYSVKKPEITETKIDKVETFMDKYHYYVIKSIMPDNTEGCPLVNSSGQVIGFLQHSMYTTDNHSTDAQYITEMQPSGLTGSEAVFRLTSIPVELPADEGQARLALMLAGQTTDSLKYARTVDLFIEKFPALTDGYTARAQKYMDANDFAAASKDMETSIKMATDKDEAHYQYARLIYQKEVYKSKLPYDDWNLDKAMDEAQKAYDIKPLALYEHLKAQIFYTKGEYEKAYDMFMALTKTDIRNPELFYEAAQCKRMLKAPLQESTVLLDSAINIIPKPYGTDAAPYFIARAAQLEEAGEYRKAVFDYNQYDTLMLGRNSAAFYYQREQCETKGHLYQQALDDIARAVQLAPQESLYWAEFGSLLLRVNKKEEALVAAQRSVALEPDFADAYLVKGLAEIQLGKKKEGLESLNKAKELGNEQAPALIEKYK